MKQMHFMADVAVYESARLQAFKMRISISEWLRQAVGEKINASRNSKSCDVSKDRLRSSDV